MTRAADDNDTEDVPHPAMKPDDQMSDYLIRRTRAVRASSWKSDITAINHLRDFLDRRNLNPEDLDRDSARDYILWVKNKDIKDHTAEEYARQTSQMYDYCSKRDEFAIDSNPIEVELEDIQFDDDLSTERRDISISEMRAAVRTIVNPMLAAVITLFLKTGIRSGELCNLDLRDVHLEHPRVKDWKPKHRPKLDGRPDTLYIASKAEMKEGEATNGEVRKVGNKRKRGTFVPIDAELKTVLLMALMIRPRSDDAGDPLFVTYECGRGSRPGSRLRPDVVSNWIADWAAQHGWWESGATLETNVTPHYFRHFFTTHMRERTNDPAFVKYIRGDKGDDIIDNYTHNWGDKVEATYREYIYKIR